MKFTYKIEVEAGRIEGKFASREELGEQIVDALDNANPSDLEGEAGGVYEIVAWDVSEA
jgi:hypothetical protein